MSRCSRIQLIFMIASIWSVVIDDDLGAMLGPGNSYVHLIVIIIVILADYRACYLDQIGTEGRWCNNSGTCSTLAAGHLTGLAELQALVMRWVPEWSSRLADCKQDAWNSSNWPAARFAMRAESSPWEIGDRRRSAFRQPPGRAGPGHEEP